jgi:hypothetical protein
MIKYHKIEVEIVKSFPPVITVVRACAAGLSGSVGVTQAAWEIPPTACNYVQETELRDKVTYKRSLLKAINYKFQWIEH